MGFPLGLVSLGQRLRVAKQAVDSEGRTIWIADAHRDDGKRFVVRADEKLSAFLELERTTSDENHRNQTISKLLASV